MWSLLRRKEKYNKMSGIKLPDTIKMIITDFDGVVTDNCVYINEDYSSKESQSYITHLKKKSRQNANKDGRLDSLAACRILERYLLEK